MLVPPLLVASPLLTLVSPAPFLTQFALRDTSHVVVGTAHTPCNSAAEVLRVMEDVKPSAIVLELDPERFELLMSDTSSGSYYGAEFLAAVQCAEEMSIPVFFGDQKPQDTLRSLLSPATPLLFPPPVPSVTIKLLPVFLSDPRKFLPLLPSALLLPFLPPDPLPLLALLLFLYRTYSIGILNRDVVLADAACYAASTVRRLNHKNVWRARFSINSVRPSPPLPSDSLPLFTTKRPIKFNEERRLSLFEPRWLRLVDFLSANPGARCALVNAANKVYTPKNDGRAADLILERKARLCVLVSVHETTRLVSGDRKAVIVLKGEEELIDVDENTVSFDNGLPLIVGGQNEYKYYEHDNYNDNDDGNDDVNDDDNDDDGEGEKSVRILSVVGLVHANGVMANIEKIERRRAI
ncbi:hypothetical protein TrVE_jg13314 [Triparma verrucosa]|uniref:Uncharacterized protein n=1 Tax=Triparma verrucosa TaxID=1606542 RepID=A0A9W7F9B7_9STRA|nr:hypothetical protein TrVE_jg13314 [Triparma verrucosa]